MKTAIQLVLLLAIVLTAACGTSDHKMRDQGHSEAYVQGFHDGRHAGMREEGNTLEHYIRDEDSFDGNPEYREGWLAGEIEGKHLQGNANIAGGVAAGAAVGAAVGSQMNRSSSGHLSAKDALKHTDTSGLENFGK